MILSDKTRTYRHVFPEAGVVRRGRGASHREVSLGREVVIGRIPPLSSAS